MRLINADELKEMINREIYSSKCPIEINHAITLINNAPTVKNDYNIGYQDGLEDGLNDIRSIGYWYLETGDLRWHCSVCHDCIQDIAANEFVTATNPYCKHCGAKMEVKK